MANKNKKTWNWNKKHPRQKKYKTPKIPETFTCDNCGHEFDESPTSYKPRPRRWYCYFCTQAIQFYHLGRNAQF